jgi:predicted TIM-barrel fold metal-dependent hydrolase
VAATPVIDAHMHVYPSREQGLRNKATYQVWEYGEKPGVRFSPYGGDVEDALTAIRESPVDRAVVINLFAVDRARASALAELPPDLDDAARRRATAEIDATMGDRLKRSNRQFCETMRGHLELIPVVAADPWALDGAEGSAHLREMVAAGGARGIKLHPVLQRFSMGDRRMYPVYETCRDLRIPIIAHAGPSRSGPQFAEPRAFADVLRDFPDLPIVLAHLGGGAWSQALEIARAFPSACFDCCEILAWTGATNAPDDEQLGRLIRDIGPERVLMGTDFPWYGLGETVEHVSRLPRLSREEKAAVLGGNAARLFGVRL